MRQNSTDQSAQDIASRADTESEATSELEIQSNDSDDTLVSVL